jgi:hypothetical protein
LCMKSGVPGNMTFDRLPVLFSALRHLTFQVADLYVSQLSRGRTLFLTRYGGARKNR